MEATTPEEPPAEPAPPPELRFDEFPAATREEWVELARGVLAKSGAADADPFVKLARTDLDGIAVPPVLFAEDAPGVPAVVREPGAWDVRVRHDDPDPARANAAVLADLEGGATSLWLGIGPGRIAPRDLARVLDGVLLDLVSVVLDVEPGLEADAAAALRDVAGDTPLTGSLGIDPVAAAFRRGSREVSWETPEVPGLVPVTVDGTAWSDAGATDADEIAIATATAVMWLRGSGAAPASVEFRFAVSDRQFPSIAKLRAARRVWARVAELCGEQDVVQRQHAVTAAAMFTTRDPWVNMLRATVAGFAGAVGGADAVTVHPFDLALGRPVPFARRIARNVHAILHDEASLARVVDPAGGSWYVEWLTDALAQQAWDRFTAIERAGGVVEALTNGELADRVSAGATAREKRVARRSLPVTGVSEFANPHEERLARDDAPDTPGLHRWAEPFERFRDHADALAADGERPTVQLLALGGRGQYAARVGFATNLLQAGGLAVEVVTDPAQCNGRVVCVCSADAVYDTPETADAVAAAREAGAEQVWLAGKVDVPGVDARLFAGCDALDVLQRVWDALEPEVAA